MVATSVLSICLLLGVGVAFAKIAPDTSASLQSNIAAITEQVPSLRDYLPSIPKFPDFLPSFSNIPSRAAISDALLDLSNITEFAEQQLSAAAASFSWFDAIAGLATYHLEVAALPLRFQLGAPALHIPQRLLLRPEQGQTLAVQLH
jgi:hypothetical protein